MQINWDSFKVYNQDSRGIRFKFEDLCRQLFVNENLSGNKQFKYLHANPNNSGLETEPIYDEINSRWIGFQAKFFDNDTDYVQIKKSASKTVEYYTGKKGIVNLVFLFYNKPIDTSAKGYLDTVKLLKASSIDLQLITDNAILDLVRYKYPYLGTYYFGNISLNSEWFLNNARYVYDALGERYNRGFNVETRASDELSLFVHDKRAAEYLNAKKIRLLADIDAVYYKNSYRDYLDTLKETVAHLGEVDEESLYLAETWQDSINDAVHGFLEDYDNVRSTLDDDRNKAYEVVNDKGKTREEQFDARKKYDELGKKIYEIDSMLKLAELVSLSEREIQLLHGEVMLLHGEAGIGKSQLMANESKYLLDGDRIVFILIASIYYTDNPIQEQIMKNLNLDYSIGDLIDTLEVLGEKENRIIPIFIDAINETWNKNLWKTGLAAVVDKVKQSSMVRLVVSYRSEYVKLLIPDSLQNMIGNGNVVNLLHSGFSDNSLEAVKEFMNHYNIPFTPLEFFGYEMSNPLFLTLYCQTYDGEEVSLPALYDRIVNRANDNICRAKKQLLRDKGYEEDVDIIGPLITEMAAYMSEHDERSILKEEIVHLKFWVESGLPANAIVPSLVGERILHDSCVDGNEHFYFSYDQMNDYFCAKAIMLKCDNKEAVCSYLTTKVLEITEDGCVGKFWNIDIFVNSCALYADRYGEECIDIIDGIKNIDDRREIFARYIDSLQWRDSRHIKKELVIDLLKKYQCSKATLWSMLIGNSVKIRHPLNADFLHEFLMHYELNRRDYLWTTYINKLTLDESNRIVQLVKMYNEGEKLSVKNEKQIELLLTLFGWVLTSSNRWLRDYTSKAMIEVLRERCDLCLYILERFKNVNDPYVIQRLYGIVFGAYSKTDGHDGRKLAEYVYEQIFNQDKVYPDILLRDYARLIIEKYLYDTPNYNGIIEHGRIIPPYNSEPIPVIKDQHYIEKKYNGASLWMIRSMTFEGMGMYGDFGRYVFQRALHSFDVKDKEMFNYAVYYIINELGFKDELFDDHDRHCGNYSRHQTVKTERIGKKYQWITMHNMLARISDNCKMVDRWSDYAGEDVVFEGAWEPYVRDFDPTLNKSFMSWDEAPYFKMFHDHALRGQEENRVSDISSKEKQDKWINEQGIFLKTLKDTMILTDDSGQEWVCLTKYCDTDRKNLNKDKLLTWCWQYAYFCNNEQAEELSKCLDKGKTVISDRVASFHETYTIFNREYPWSPSCKDFEEGAWVDVSVKTGNYKIITEKIWDSSHEWIETVLQSYHGINEEKRETQDEDVVSYGPFETNVRERTIERKVEEEKDIGSLLHATTDLLWEEEFDASKEEPISYSVPCRKLIDVMGLKQLDRDGFFFDSNKKLAAFDTMMTQKARSVVVRKDVLDGFMQQTGMKLIWIIDAGKEIHSSDYISRCSHWEAVMKYADNKVDGKFYLIQDRNNV